MEKLYQIDCYFHGNLVLRQWYKTKKSAIARKEKAEKAFDSVTIKEVQTRRYI